MLRKCTLTHGNQKDDIIPSFRLKSLTRLFSTHLVFKYLNYVATNKTTSYNSSLNPQPRTYTRAILRALVQTPCCYRNTIFLA